MIRKLKIKFMCIVMSFITVLLVAILAFIFFFVKRGLYNDSIDAMREYAREQPSLVDQNKYDRFFESNNDRYAQFDLFMLEYYPSTSTVVYSFEDEINENQREFVISIAEKVINASENTGVVADRNLRFYRAQYRSLTGNCLRLVFLDKAYEDNIMSDLSVTLSVIGGLGFVAFFFIALLITHIAVSPVATSWRQQKQLVSDVSHELKTPIAVIGANTELVMSHGNSTVAEERVRLGYIKDETERMTALINNMLYLARSDEAENSYRKEALDLSDTVLGAALPFESLCYERELELVCNVEPAISLEGNGELISRLVGILIDNACKYSFPKGQVRLDLYSSSDRVILAVNNKGEVISAENIRHIFERFYRADDSRSHSEARKGIVKAGGHGLGLSIAKQITEFHNGRISAVSDEQNGTTFICVFKK